MNVISLGWGIISLLIYCLSLIVILRLRLRIHPIIQQAACALFVHIISLIIASLFFHGLPYWHGAAIYWLGVWAYLYFFSAIYTSITLDILQYTSTQLERKTHVKNLLDMCVQPSFDNRINVMQTSGLVSQTSGHFSMTEKGKIMVQKILFLHRLFGIKSSGLYREG